MSTIAWIAIGLGVWALISIPSALLIGAFLRHGLSEDPPSMRDRLP